MTKLIAGTEKPICTQKGLLRRNRRGESWRAIGDYYGVNQRYPYEFAVHGIIPSNLEVCYRMGLKRRPVPRQPRPLTPFKAAVLQMADETREVMPRVVARGERLVTV